MRDVQSPWFGVNLDTGNFRSSDPYADLAQLAPYADQRAGEGVDASRPAADGSPPISAGWRKIMADCRLPRLHRARVRRDTKRRAKLAAAMSTRCARRFCGRLNPARSRLEAQARVVAAVRIAVVEQAGAGNCSA